jgi:23S rRNA pseudouridine1911/1915/1917 synthase
LKQTTGIISSTPFTAEVEEIEDTAAEAEWRQLVVPVSLHSARLDRALVEMVDEFSRSYLQQLVEAGLISVNGACVRKPAARVKAGDVLVIELRPTPQSQAFTPQKMDMPLVYEDEHIWIIDKPPGLVVHPAPGNWSGTLLNGLLAYDPRAAGVPRAGIVHRLDKDTSGLMVVARSRTVMDKLVHAIAARQVSREYFAIAHAPWAHGSQKVTVDLPIGRDPRNRLRMAVVDMEKTSGKLAKTDVFLVTSSELGCLVRCVLHTGRTHQIRVHMSSLRLALVGDATYGGAIVNDMQRQALHACRLAFAHPVSGEPLVFTSRPPQDFVDLAAFLKLDSALQ